MLIATLREILKIVKKKLIALSFTHKIFLKIVLKSILL